MAFDGITIANIVTELNQTITGGKINKIAQPENDELIITIKNQRKQYRLFLSASASLPLIYLTETNKPSPLTAPNFCMLLRKHIGSGKIIAIEQPGMERIIRFTIEHLNELGDLCTKYLIVEIMGKHSNIIFCNEEDQIIDSIKHVSAHMSSVREVLPGRPYFIPETQSKLNPFVLTEEIFQEKIFPRPVNVAKAIYTSITGISPLMAEEVCYRAGIDGGIPTDGLEDVERVHLAHTFLRMVDDIRDGHFEPNIIYKGKEPVEFACFPLSQYQDYRAVSYPSIFPVLETYYAEKNIVTKMRQKTVDLRKIVQNALERNVKKYQLQQKQLKDTEKKEKYRVWGELLNTYGYEVEPGAKSMEALNYYTNEMIQIPLDETMTPQENAKKYFDKYSKLKRTKGALDTLLQETGDEIKHLESIAASLDIASSEEDLVQIKEEMMEYGYVKRKNTGGKKVKVTSRPYHYISSDGYDIYVGKNNFQNDELSFKFASGNDWWFHAKGQPGSHVIVKSKNEELPDRTFEEAGKLAAYYSKGRQAPKVEIDYTQKKNLRKPTGGKPGFVVYYTNYSLLIEPDITGLQQIQ
ncbi:MAG: NFACT RNA binding domain-containing protein [Oliverpabstia intestinalis]|jgi:predicted ribosome quality control (RQC) complex YloA/Tae2 family protein|uniref:Rqc2 homolog RqcH n=1 Tax=Oliverpabstia intestinalis TaxID=2606633 RepID=A0A7X2P1J0_9FIRM|nr:MULTISPECIES: NFACT RNA binding domain-containing protein [Oliverpabstia]MCI7525769.1 NFACT family protein [Oliverpabstia sp.]MDY5792065.1 NFACT RNA binding domain-containing protein [Oliverpabstia intestinalis]MEE1179463.1 NFACT RNA binding domain-containing protein [Lachnospiraceae bacterium]MST65427.1 fibronectin/fibrinogen-binding protein [Oliverpabstia intestinalis]